MAVPATGRTTRYRAFPRCAFSPVGGKGFHCAELVAYALLPTACRRAALAREHIDLVAVRAELDYRFPLRSGDRFWVGLNVEQASKVRFDFLQDIYRSMEDKLILNAKITGSSLNEQGQPFVPEQIRRLFGGKTRNSQPTPRCVVALCPGPAPPGPRP